MKLITNLTFQENKSYSLWVTASDGTSIPQRTEVFATITDKTGARPNVPRPPPFPIPSYPSVPLPPKYTTRTPQRTTKAPESFIEEITVPDTTTTTTSTTTTAKPIQKENKNEPHENKMVGLEESKRNNSKEAINENPVTNSVPLTVIPFVVIGAIVTIVAGAVIFFWKKNEAKKSKTEKDDMVSFLNVMLLNYHL